MLKQDQRENFRLREGPDGKWARLSPTTRRKRRKAKNKRRKRRPLQATLGKLKTAFWIDLGRQYLLAVSKVPWAHVHQDGGAVGKGARMPKRTHLYLSHEFIGRIRDGIAQYLTKGL